MMPLTMKYFVLKPRAKYKSDPFAKASQTAMSAYAESILEIDKEFSEQLSKWAIDEAIAQDRMPEDK